MHPWLKHISTVRLLAIIMILASSAVLCLVGLWCAGWQPFEAANPTNPARARRPPNAASRPNAEEAAGSEARPSQQETRQLLSPPALLAAPDGGPAGETERGATPRSPTKAYPLLAFAYHYKADIYGAVTADPPMVGYARRGTRLRVKKRVFGKGCKGGKWYLVRGGGYVCTARGYVVSEAPDNQDLSYRLPERGRPLQHRYGKVKTNGEPRLFRLPTAKEEGLIARAVRLKQKLPEVVDRTMDGVFLVALDRLAGPAGRRYWRTVRGRYVRQEDVKLFPRFQMRGEKLSGEGALPLAFVFGEDRPLYCKGGRKLRECGVAKKHARFRVLGTEEHGGRRMVSGPSGVLVAREGLRLARRVKRPDGVPAGKKWIHVDLSQQALVAYEGDRPVFATLISSGKKGYEPPTGLFRIVHKHVSITMSGDDPVDGWYEVEEVPWSMYYWEGFALHGAYWHDKFGQVKSHGCSNLAPPDARWLFHWSEPKVPEDWHGVVKKGTHLYFTSGASKKDAGN